MTLNIPEGYTFVKRGPGVAAALLEAADRIKADRKEGVRTTSQGGYFVADDIAAEWQKSLPEADVEEVDEEAEAAAQAAEERGYPDGDPASEWTVAQIEAWAAAQDPAVDLGSGNKAEKLKAALDSLESD